jgi:hypothetical protein
MAHPTSNCSDPIADIMNNHVWKISGFSNSAPAIDRSEQLKNVKKMIDQIDLKNWQ